VTAPPPNGRDRERILAERARALAAPLHAEAEVETFGVLLVAVGKERYAFGLGHVLSIERVTELTPLPGVPDFWSGIANIHGTLYAVLDLGRYLGIATEAFGAEQMLVLATGGGIEVGLLVDEVSDVSWLRADEIDPAPSAGRGRVLQGVTRELVALLDVQALLSDRDLIVDDGAT
jgi:purine-binding chemotaxis protein CheW